MYLVPRTFSIHISSLITPLHLPLLLSPPPPSSCPPLPLLLLPPPLPFSCLLPSPQVVSVMSWISSYSMRFWTTLPTLIKSSHPQALLLSGRSGVGRYASVSLMAHMHQMEIITPHVSRNYQLKQFKNDLKNVSWQSHCSVLHQLCYIPLVVIVSIPYLPPA